MKSFRVLSASVALFVLTACASGSASSAKPSGGGASAKVSDAAAIASAIDAASAPFVGSRNSKRYYPAACHTVKLIKPADQVGFSSQKDAEAAGYAKDLYSTDCQY